MLTAAGSIGALCATSLLLRPQTEGGRAFCGGALLVALLAALGTAFYRFTPAAEGEWLLWRRAFGGSERARWKEDGDLVAATVARVQRCLAEGEAADGIAGVR